MFRTFVAALGIGVMASLVACSPEGGPGAPQAEKQLLKTQSLTTLNVNFGSVIQDNFLGLGAVYHGFSYMPESNAQGMTDALRTTEFDRVNRIKLNIARTWYGSDWAMPTWGGAYDWNSTKMTAFYQWLQAMKDRNVQVALNVGWWFTEHTCSNGAPTSCTPQVPTDVNVYTRWVSDSLNQLVNVKGFTNIKYVILFTEPLTYCGCGNIPSGYTQKSYYWYVIQQLHNRLVSDGRRGLVKMVGPNTNDIENTNGKAAVQDSVANINPYLDAYSFHTYNMADYDGWSAAVNNGLSAMASTGKPFWFDEYGKQDEAYRSTADYGTYLAEINAAVLNAGGQTSLIWLYQDQYYVSPLNTLTNGDSFVNGLHRWGTMPWLPTSTSVRPAWRSFGMMSRFLGGAGTKIVDTSKSVNGVRISAVQLPDGNVSVMIINSNTSGADINVNFASALGKTLWRHLYDPAAALQVDTIIGASKEFPSVSTNLTDTLPARGVAIYTSIDDGTRPSTSSNLALGAVLSASSSAEFSGWGLAKINDGQSASVSSSLGWSSDANPSIDHSESLQLDLGTVKSVGRVDLYPRSDPNNVGQGFPIDFIFETSQDALSWIPAVTRTGFAQPGNGVQSFVFASTQSRYVRIRGTRLRLNPLDGNQYRMQFAEVELYSGSSNPAFFSSGFETTDVQPTWTDTVDTAGGSINNVSGYCCGLPGVETGVRSNEVAHTGSSSLVYSGLDNSASSSYAYMKVFDVNVPVLSNTVLSYWIYPMQANGKCVAVDLYFTDGSSLRNLNATDQNGVSLHPGTQCLASRTLNAWNNVQSAIGSVAAGKTIDRILVAYDQAANTGQYRGYIDDIQLY